MGNSVMLNGVEYAGEQIAYKDSTYELVSKVAYLIGVPLRIFQNEHEPPKIEIYNRLEQDKNARIIRNLCIIRTAIERNYRKINDIMRMEYRGLLSMPEILPMSSMQQLSNDGISFIKKSSTKLCHHIIEINRLISDRINNCKSLFPIWINWAYIKELFIMPNGLTEDGTKDAGNIHHQFQGGAAPASFYSAVMLDTDVQLFSSLHLGEANFCPQVGNPHSTFHRVVIHDNSFPPERKAAEDTMLSQLSSLIRARKEKGTHPMARGNGNIATLVSSALNAYQAFCIF